MAWADLRKLWKLHLIDAAITEIRARAATLDTGKALQAQIDVLSQQLSTDPAKLLMGEQQDLEFQQKSIDDKIAKFEKDLYSGKIVNSREVSTIEKEVEILKKQRSKLDERILVIWEEIPPLKVELDKLEKALVAKKAELVERKKLAVITKAELEASFKEKSAARPIVAKDQNLTLLAKYEAIRPKHNGVGMAEVVKGKQCGACGTLLPERTLQACLDDKVVTCESCHRILYYPQGVA
ncbi:MAG: hypothetical protein IT203_03365 [Fimbriimonadaceae bacterium]|nr:hypothetical protein [Fimbriimonadaceae bacterium]